MAALILDKKQFESALEAARNSALVKGAFIASALDGVSRSLRGVLQSSVETTMGFDSGMARVKALSGATGAEFNKLRESAIDLGAKSVFSASQVAEGMQTVAAAGYDTNKILGVMPGLLSTAAASGASFGSATKIVVSTLNQFGLGVEKAGHVGDVLAAAANASLASMEDLGVAMNYAGPVAKNFGASMEETAAAMAIMSNAGLQASTIGTSLRSVFTRLASEPKAVKAALETLNVTLKTADGNIRPFADILAELQGKFRGLGEAQRVQLAKQIAGQEALSGFLALVDAAPGKFDSLTSSFVRSSEGISGASDTMAKTMTDTLPGAIEMFKGAMESAKISIGTAWVPAIRLATELLTSLVDSFNALPSGVKTAVAVFLGVSAAMASVASAAGNLVISLLPLAILLGVGAGGAAGAAGAAGGAAAAGGIAGGLAAMKAGLGGLIGSLGGVGTALATAATAVGVFGAAIGGIALGSWIRENTELGRWIREWGGEYKVVESTMDSLIAKHKDFLASQGLVLESQKAQVAASKLVELADKTGIATKEQMIQKFRYLIELTEQGGQVGEDAYKRLLDKYDQVRNFASPTVEAVNAITNALKGQSEAVNTTIAGLKNLLGIFGEAKSSAASFVDDFLKEQKDIKAREDIAKGPPLSNDDFGSDESFDANLPNESLETSFQKFDDLVATLEAPTQDLATALEEADTGLVDFESSVDDAGESVGAFAPAVDKAKDALAGASFKIEASLDDVRGVVNTLAGSFHITDEAITALAPHVEGAAELFRQQNKQILESIGTNGRLTAWMTLRMSQEQALIGLMAQEAAGLTGFKTANDIWQEAMSRQTAAASEAATGYGQAADAAAQGSAVFSSGVQSMSSGMGRLGQGMASTAQVMGYAGAAVASAMSYAGGATQAAAGAIASIPNIVSMGMAAIDEAARDVLEHTAPIGAAASGMPVGGSAGGIGAIDRGGEASAPETNPNLQPGGGSGSVGMGGGGGGWNNTGFGVGGGSFGSVNTNVTVNVGGDEIIQQTQRAALSRGRASLRTFGGR